MDSGSIDVTLGLKIKKENKEIASLLKIQLLLNHNFDKIVQMSGRFLFLIFHS